MAETKTFKTLYQALLDVQRDMPSLQKSAINPHFKNKYVPLEELNPKALEVLNKYEFVWLTFPTIENGEKCLGYALVYTPTGDKIEGTMSLNIDTTTPQAQGSAITYARRYALMAVLGLVADADDDNQAEADKTKGPATESSKQNLIKSLDALGLTVEDYEKRAGLKLDEMTQAQVADAIAKAKTRLMAAANK